MHEREKLTRWLQDPGVVSRFWAKVDRRDDDSCWPWLASTRMGYGRIFPKAGVGIAAHRFAYELLIGPIPEGLVIDHLCRNRGCMNPAHMEPVTNAENVLRGDGPTAQRARQTHCKRGHELTPDNLLKDKVGKRRCKLCRRIRQQHLRSLRPRRKHGE